MSARQAATATLLFLSLSTATAVAASLQGRVVHVIDGDGLVVLVGEKRLNVRLEHIDAPERGQPYDIQSRQSLIAICSGERATIQASGKDRNGRTLGRVSCNGIDAGAALRLAGGSQSRSARAMESGGAGAAVGVAAAVPGNRVSCRSLTT